jgi:hypothetical protein
VQLDFSATASAIILYLATHMSESFLIRTGNVCIDHERYLNRDSLQAAKTKRMFPVIVNR